MTIKEWLIVFVTALIVFLIGGWLLSLLVPDFNYSPGCGMYVTQYYEWTKQTPEIMKRFGCEQIYIGNYWDAENKTLTDNRIICMKKDCKGDYCKLSLIKLDIV